MKTLSKKKYIIILILLTFFLNFGLKVSAEETIKYLDCNIVSKISNNRYEIIIDNADNTHALLETVETNFTSRGQTDILVERIKKVEVTLNNGFKEKWDLYREVPSYDIESYNYLYNIESDTNLELIAPVNIKKITRGSKDIFFIESIIQNTGIYNIDYVSYNFEIYETKKLKNKILTIKSTATSIKPNGIKNLQYGNTVVANAGDFSEEYFKNFIIKIEEKSREKNKNKWINYKNENLVKHIELNIRPATLEPKYIIDKNNTIYIMEEIDEPKDKNHQYTLKSIGSDGSVNWNLFFEKYFQGDFIINQNNNTLHGISNDILYAIDLNGNIKWTQNGFNRPSKYVTDENGNIYITTSINNKPYLIKFDSKGNKKWEYLIKDKNYYYIENIIYDEFENNVYLIGEENFLGAYNSKGNKVWTYENDDLSKSLSVNQNIIINGSRAFNKDGELLWYNDKFSFISKNIIRENTIYIIGRDSEDHFDHLFALDFEGTIKWKSKNKLKNNIVIANENTIIFSDSQSINVVDKNGKLKWIRENMDEQPLPLLINNSNFYYINYGNDDKYNNGITVLNLRDYILEQ